MPPSAAGKAMVAVPRLKKREVTTSELPGHARVQGLGFRVSGLVFRVGVWASDAGNAGAPQALRVESSRALSSS